MRPPGKIAFGQELLPDPIRYLRYRQGKIDYVGPTPGIIANLTFDLTAPGVVVVTTPDGKKYVLHDEA